MKILFFSPSQEDYLAATLLHGLRSLPGVETRDVPRYDCAYQNFPREKLAGLHGKGFTLFGLLPETDLRRPVSAARSDPRDFDLVVFADIWNQTDLFLKLVSRLDPRKTAIVDGSDDPALVPQAGRWFRRPRLWMRLQSLRKFPTWKREWTLQSQPDAWHRLVPPALLKFLPRPRHLHRISFAIPEVQIVGAPPAKTKDFPAHIVDGEVREVLGAGSGGHVFDSEEEYRRDLQSSRFGITTKRSGWDCLRHYEIAANGAVPCFRELEKKPKTCAPHGLDETNSISYSSAKDLMGKLRHVSDGKYRALQEGSLRWAMANTTTCRARDLVKALGAAG